MNKFENAVPYIIAILGIVVMSIIMFSLCYAGDPAKHREEVLAKITTRDGCKKLKIKKVVKYKGHYKFFVRGCGNHWLYYCNYESGCLEWK